MGYVVEPIGIIHSPFKTKEEAPPQGIIQPEVRGTVEVYPEFAEGLKDVEMFSHLYLLFWFDRAGEVILVRPTFYDDESHGVFASRHPCRPNGIGLSIVQLGERRGNVLEVGGIDMLDGTPLLDIKPYIPRFDHRPDATDGWLAGKAFRPKPAGRE